MKMRFKLVSVSAPIVALGISFGLSSLILLVIGKDPLETFGTNVIGSSNILEAVRLNKIPNLVYITSDKCYLNLGKKTSFKESDTLGGLDNYSSSKASAELIFYSYFSHLFVTLIIYE